MKTPAHIFWAFANWYGLLLGRRLFAPLHYIQLNLALHGLGYDNSRHTGEEWFITKILKKADIRIAIDIGANVGAYSADLAKHLTATIYAVEPSSSSFKELQQVAVLYESRIIPVHAAISDHSGTATLYSRAELSEKATLDPTLGEIPTSLKEEVRTLTLDDMIREQNIPHVDFVKIDTEGHESEVFLGMQKMLMHRKPQFIQFEFNRVHLYRNTTLWSLCQKLPGYELYRLLPNGWIKIDPAKQANNIFMFCNIIAKRIS